MTSLFQKLKGLLMPRFRAGAFVPDGGQRSFAKIRSMKSGQEFGARLSLSICGSRAVGSAHFASGRWSRMFAEGVSRMSSISGLRAQSVNGKHLRCLVRRGFGSVASLVIRVAI